MNFHCLKHVPFEGPGNIGRWAMNHGHGLVVTNAWQYEFPEEKWYDVLVVMGGPMSANDEHMVWLKQEKKIIERAISKNKKVIGICLGAQLIADVLGAKVYKNPEKEIGWFEVELTPGGRKNPLFQDFPDSFNVFQWHGETFDLPENAVHLAKSEGCANQAFLYDGNVLGLQFHIEGMKQGLMQMMANSLNEMTPGRYVQSEDEIRAKTDFNLEPTSQLLYRLLERFTG